MDKGYPRNILYCEGNIDGTVGGSYFSLLYLVSSLDKSKYNPVVVFHSEHALLSRYRAAGIRTLILPAYQPRSILRSDPSSMMVRTFNPVLRWGQKVWNFTHGFFGRGFYYARLLRQLDIDLVHLNNSVIRNNDWMLGALLARIPCITHERGINNHYPWLSRFLGRRLKAIICISDAVRDNLQKHSIDSGNLVTIHNGIDPNVMSVTTCAKEVRDCQGINPSTRIIGIIGNIKFWKGQETMMHALPLVLESVPDLVCMFVGGTSPTDQPYHDYLYKLAADLDISQNIRFTGYTRNVADFINAMEIVIHTSVEPEPFGRVLIEAMAMCKPVIGARGGAVTEIIEEGKTGLTFPPGDANALADTVLALMKDSDRVQEMGRAGYLRLCEKFLISANVEKTERLYETVLKTGLKSC